MRPRQALHARAQSLWLDNITRSMLESGQIQRYIDRYSVTGLTSNPSIFDKAIASGDYDDAIAEKATRGITAEDLPAPVRPQRRRPAPAGHQPGDAGQHAA